VVPSLYIHIPFCRKKCLYCDFCSVTYNESLAADYVNVLCSQINGLQESFSTIYIGGGTPTVLGNNLLVQLLKSLKKLVFADTEFTVEANPESLNEKAIDILLNTGVNRLSIGVQSFNDDTLKKLGRIHNAQTAYEAVTKASKRGFKNISIDLMFGAWDETIEDWEEELKKAVSLPVQHISTYSLTYEKNTPLCMRKEKGQIQPLENETIAEMYEHAIDYLEDNGFKHYEISNFAKEGFSCRHNLNYWENSPYRGLGISAVSYSEGIRKENITDTLEYIKRVRSGEDIIQFQEKLSNDRRAKETAAVKIRTKKGIDFAWFKKKTGFDFLVLEHEPIASLREKELIDYTRIDGTIKGVSLTKKGFLFCDSVSSELL